MGGLLLQKISLTRNERQKGREWRGSYLAYNLLLALLLIKAYLSKLEPKRLMQPSNYHFLHYQYNWRWYFHARVTWILSSSALRNDFHRKHKIGKGILPVALNHNHANNAVVIQMTPCIVLHSWDKKCAGAMHINHYIY